MKKILVVVSVVLVALVIFGAGFAFAQSQVASAAALPQFFGHGGMGGRGDGNMMGGGGQVHEYVEQALADKLGMTKSDLETQLSSGKSMYQVALDKGIVVADVSTLLAEVHTTALSKAVTDGLLTQVQADTMLKTMTDNGFFTANCTMGGPDYQGGQGARNGRGGGMMGGRGGNQAPQATPQVNP